MSTRSFQAGDAYGYGITISNSSGALANADSLPTASLYRNGSVDSAVTVTVANSATGIYAVSCTIPSGYAVGDKLSLLLLATVGGVSTGAFVDHIRLVGYPNNAIPNAAAGANNGVPVLDGTGKLNYTLNKVALANIAILDTLVIDYDGVVRSAASSPGTQVNFDAADKRANGFANGPINYSIYVVRGTGVGQTLRIATIAGASGAKVGTVVAGDTIAPTLSTDSQYVWLDAPWTTASAFPTTAPVNWLTSTSFAADALTATALSSGAVTKLASGLGISLGTGTVTGVPTTTSIQLTGSNLTPVSGQYSGRRLYVTSGTRQTYLTDPCQSHAVAGSGNQIVHTFTFATAEALLAAGDTVAVLGT